MTALENGMSPGTPQGLTKAQGRDSPPFDEAREGDLVFSRGKDRRHSNHRNDKAAVREEGDRARAARGKRRLNFWTIDRVAAALENAIHTREPNTPPEIRGITTDSRAVSSGQLFVALVGEKFDGHDFLESAIAQGASAIVVSRPSAKDYGVTVFRVPDTLVALGQLGNFWRRAWGGPIVMVAGSNGKTTTKDIIRSALGRSMKVHATTGNLNNRIGVPLTLLAIPSDCEIAVVEAGTNIPGEVAILRDIIDPDISVITSIGEEHLEGLGDLEGVLREEASAFDGVRIAIAPSAQPEVGAAARSRAVEVVEAGLDQGDVKADSWSIAPDGSGAITLGHVRASAAP